MDLNTKNQKMTVNGIKAKYFVETDTHMLHVSLDVKLESEAVKEWLGEFWADTLFDVRAVDDEGKQKISKIAPAQICAPHTVTIKRKLEDKTEEVMKFECQPELRAFSVEDGKARIPIMLPIEVKTKDAAGMVIMWQGKTVSVTMDAKQIALPIEGAPKIGKKNFGHPVVGNGSAATVDQPQASA